MNWDKQNHSMDLQYSQCFSIPCYIMKAATQLHTTHPFNGPLSRTTRVSRYQQGKTNLDFTEARDSEWQWHQLDHMQVCNLLQTDNHARTPPLSFLQAGCPSCHPTNSVKALKLHTNGSKHSEICYITNTITLYTLRKTTSKYNVEK